jgi:hypothetical protein
MRFQNFQRILIGNFRKYRINDIIAARQHIDDLTLEPTQIGRLTPWEGELLRIRNSAYRVFNAYLQKKPNAMDDVHPNTLGSAVVYVALGEMNRRDALRYGAEYIHRLADAGASRAAITIRINYRRNIRLQRAAQSIRSALGAGKELWQYLE